MATVFCKNYIKFIKLFEDGIYLFAADVKQQKKTDNCPHFDVLLNNL